MKLTDPKITSIIREGGFAYRSSQRLGILYVIPTLIGPGGEKLQSISYSFPLLTIEDLEADDWVANNRYPDRR